MNVKPISKEDIILAISNSNSMLSASKILNVPYTTFLRYSKIYGLFRSNQRGLGVKRKSKYSLDKILKGDHPEYSSTTYLKKRLLDNNVLEKTCSNCGLQDWLGLPLVLELHHVDGDSSNNKIENLKILCPNCHSQTSTYRNRRRIF